MEIIIPPRKEITYVGFMTNELGEFVVGTDGEAFYHGPFLSPNLNYLEEYNVDSVSTKEEFEKLYKVKIYNKNLLEEVERVLADYKEKCSIENEEYYMIWKNDSIAGDLKFVVTKQVNDLITYIKENKENNE